MRTQRLIFLLGITLILSTSFAEARSVGTSGANYLKLGLGPRPSAMGDAFVALADDINSMEYNPAGLANLNPNVFNAMYEHVFWFADVEYEILALGQNLGEGQGGGFRLLYRHMNDVDNDLADEPPVKAYDFATSLGYGFQIANFSLGVNLKFLYSFLGNDNIFGGAIDLGAQTTFPDLPFQFGVAIQNIGPDIRGDPLPMCLRLGGAYKAFFGENKEHIVNAGLALFQPMDHKLTIQVGGEYWYMQTFGARLGFHQQIGGNDLQTNDLLSTLSAGFGIRWASLQLDYAFVPYASLGYTHRISITAFYGPLKEEILK
jgi:hypothetical protein